MPRNNIQRGMTVYGADNQALGTVDEVTDSYYLVNGQQYPLDSGYRVEDQNIYLTGGGNYSGTDQSNLKVPVYEEQLNVDKRQANLGEVQIHKTVNQEQVNVPVELRREEVNVNQRDVDNRPLNPGEAAQAFQEGTIRVPVRGEEAVVNKQAVVTGEVDVNKQVRAEKQNIADTVRREQVQVDDSSLRQTPGVVRSDNAGYNNTTNYAGDTGNYAATNYRSDTGDFATGPADDQYRNTDYSANTGNYGASNLQEGLDVVGNDGEFVGRIKELNNNDFRVDRKMKPDINVTYTAIQNVDGSQVVLNAPGADFNNFL
ncbi:MAG: DUF2382 domain-containing protein [Chloroflexi bacterium]|nr:DUF2382 domain-containing protein [Chloroflexota bacterium]